MDAKLDGIFVSLAVCVRICTGGIGVVKEVILMCTTWLCACELQTMCHVLGANAAACRFPRWVPSLMAFSFVCAACTCI